MFRHSVDDLGGISEQSFASPNICSGSTLTTFAALLKDRFMDSSMVEELAYPENPFLTMVEKRGDTGMMGDQMPVPILTGNPQGVGAVFATAQTNASNIIADKFNIVAGDYYGVVQIGDKVLEASRTNQGAYLENKKVEIDGLYETAGENLSIYSWGNGGQYLGQVAVIQNTNDVVLAAPESVAMFEVGMVVVASATDGSDPTNALKTGSASISAINRGLGIITLNTVAGITGTLAIGDFLFRQADFFGNTGAVVLAGVQAFITPNDTPPALWGLSAAKRATDPQRYAGCRVASATVVGKTFEERIKILIAQMTGRFKAKAPTAGWMHPEDFQVLETLMQARGLRALEDDSTQFGFMKIDIMTSAGRVPIYTDRHCPRGTFFALRMEDFWISSMGELLHPQKGDGLEILRRATSTDYEFRLLSYPLLACRAPKNSGRISLI
jgi:hypothetical protein